MSDGVCGGKLAHSQVKTGLSSSCTSLSIWINMLTVISRSAKTCSKLYACSYDCASKHIENVATAL